MEIPQKIIKFLEKNKIKYQTIKHRTVYTAFDKSQTLKVPQKIIAKVLVLKMDGNLAIVLIAANKNLDLKSLKKVAKIKKIEFVSEKIIKNKFKGIKVGAIPPLGNLWQVPTFIDRSLTKEKEIIFSGGNYNFSIKVKTKDLAKISADLVFGSFSLQKK